MKCLDFSFTIYFTFDGMVGTVAEHSNAALRVTGSIPARSKYVYDLHLVVPVLAECICAYVRLNVSKLSHDTGIIPTVGHFYLFCYVFILLNNKKTTTPK